MKLKSLIMFSAAALAFAACSNEEDVNGGIKGDATVTVNIQDAITRAIETPTTGNNGETFPVVIESGTLTLTLAEGEPQTKDLKGYTWGDDIVFQNVRNPRSIKVEINGGVAEGQMDMTADIIQSGLAEPLYAETDQFSVNGNNYTVSLAPNHRLARLQFSGIKHVDEEGECSYSSLIFEGLYLNGVRKSEKDNTELEENTAGSAWSNITAEEGGWDLPFFDWAVYNEGIGESSVVVPAGDVTEWPTSDCYAYNILPAAEGNLPILTLCFSNAVQPDVTVVGDTKTRYASVAKYLLDTSKNDKVTLGEEAGVKDGEIVAFKAGYIYNITSLTFDDDDLGFTPDGKKGTLTATVTVTPWTLVNGTVEWN